MGELDATGEIVTGALLGRAVEPGAGEGGGHASICLNCGTALVDSHCHRCGQSGHIHRTLSGMAHDLVHGVFHFDGKLWRTLPLLAWRPGELTRRYIEGERARFVSPMALFLFSIFFMFAVFSWVGLVAPTDITQETQLERGFQKAREDVAERRKDALEDRSELKAGDPKIAVLNQRIAKADAELAAIGRSEAEFRRSGVSTTKLSVAHTGWEALDHGLEKWQKNPSLMLYKLQSSIYKFSWLLIPLSLPFVWLLFCWRREYRLYDHTVFITYSIAFMSLLFVVIAVAAPVGVSEGWIVAASFLIPFIHLFRQLKQAYRLRWFSALLRTMVLAFLIQIVLILFLVILLALGMFG
ncbi:MAG: DUF3667 domain-containing protein [Pseudomonadota bacterium]